jgi:hypothetical protein
MKPKHKCPHYDFLELHPFDLEMSACRCDFNKDVLPDAIREFFGELNVKPLYKSTKDKPNG